MRTYEVFLQEEVASLEARGLRRALRLLEGQLGPRAIIDSREVINLCSNNYLGLASHPGLKQAAQKAIEDIGCGSGASRLVSGNLPIHEALEEKLAHFLGAEAVLLFSSGYLANLGAIACLVGPDDLILSDQLNHACIIDGCKLSRAEVKVYPHRNTEALEQLLRRSPGARRKLIVTEALFSMNGDLAPLEEICRLAREHSCMLMVDEAHSFGLLGPGGRGALELLGLKGQETIFMATLGKALGSSGAFVAGSQCLRDYLMNRCRTFIFSTSPPPAPLASALEALKILEEEPAIREALAQRADFLRKELRRLGFDLMDSQAHIIPILMGDSALCLQFSVQLFNRGIFIQAIRPPTVPPGGARLRLTPMATHSWDDLHQALFSIEEVGKSLGVV